VSPSPIGTSIDRAIEILRNGGVIGFPTETVYGLAADASNCLAVDRIFDIKGRPRNHPLIVHLDSLAEARLWSADWSASAEILGALFWPGPLTVIVTKALTVHREVTGGLETLALRVPNHAVALEVLRGLEGGIAAPSANKFGKVSPTTAEHVLADLGSEVDYILDGGPCSIGLESTIVDCSAHTIQILRPGAISLELISQVLPIAEHMTGPSRAPGMLESHYAPTCRLTVVADMNEAQSLLGTHAATQQVRIIDGSSDPSLFATQMYSQLRQCDDDGIDQAIVVLPSPNGIGHAIRDRLLKAAHGAQSQSH
jgi:L-threonylcarbamoyladenylate synthase